MHWLLLLLFIIFSMSCGTRPVKNCKPNVEVPKNYRVQDLTDIKFTDYSLCERLWWWE